MLARIDEKAIKDKVLLYLGRREIFSNFIMQWIASCSQAFM